MTIDANDIAKKHGPIGLRRAWDGGIAPESATPPAGSASVTRPSAADERVGCGDIDAAPKENVAGARGLLNGLVQRATADPNVIFSAAVLEDLAKLKEENRAAFETLRSELEAAGCRMTALDDALAGDGEKGERPSKQADVLIDFAKTASLFHTPDGTGYADVLVNGHRETWPIRGRGFRRWLLRRYFMNMHSAPGTDAVQSAINIAEAQAQFDAPERSVHVRVGAADGGLYLDLADDQWRAVEITVTGWRIINNPPVRFRRAPGMLPLPAPARGGSIETLRQFLNVQFNSNFVLAVAWLLACLRDRGPYPILAIAGEQGSAKSTFSRILRALVDPNTAPLRALPRNDRDLFIAANNSHMIAYDNVSGLPDWLSDALCRLSTGGGFSVRQLYSDQEETLFSGIRPALLNGIEDVVTKPDLADRALFLTLEPIPDNKRRPESEIWTTFEKAQSQILGALLDAMVVGIDALPQTSLPALPRMADFALFATAAEKALWQPGTFWSAYCGNRHEAEEAVIEADPIADAIRGLMAARAEWAGTATELLIALEAIAGDRITKSKSWPSAPNKLSGKLRRAAPILRRTGITIVTGHREGRSRDRLIRVLFEPPESARFLSSASPAPSAGTANPSVSAASPLVPLRTIDGAADDQQDAGETIVRTEMAETKARTIADDRLQASFGSPDRCHFCGEADHDGDPLSLAAIGGEQFYAHKACLDQAWRST